ncbi:MAG: hypothetical protein V1882_08485, partial [Candidatus Omnitrophota bacterium]
SEEKIEAFMQELGMTRGQVLEAFERDRSIVRYDLVANLKPKIEIVRKLGIPKKDEVGALLWLLKPKVQILQEIVRVAGEAGHRFENARELFEFYQNLNGQVWKRFGETSGKMVRNDPKELEKVVLVIEELMRKPLMGPESDPFAVATEPEPVKVPESVMNAAWFGPSPKREMLPKKVREHPELSKYATPNLLAKLEIVRKLGIAEKDEVNALIEIISIHISILQAMVRIAEEAGRPLKDVRSVVNIYKKLNKEVFAEWNITAGKLVRRDPEELQRTVIPVLRRMIRKYHADSLEAKVIAGGKLRRLLTELGISRGAFLKAAEGYPQLLHSDPADNLMPKVLILQKLGIPKEKQFKSLLRILSLNVFVLDTIVQRAITQKYRFRSLEALISLYKKVNQKVEAETGRMIGSLVKEDPELLQRTVISILERLTFASSLFDQRLLELVKKRGLDRASPQGAAQGLAQSSDLGHTYDLRIKTQILRQLGISEKDRTGGLRTIKDLNVLVLDAIVQNAAARGYRFETLRELADLYKTLNQEVKAKTGQWVGPLVREDLEELQRTVIPILEKLVPESLPLSEKSPIDALVMELDISRGAFLKAGEAHPQLRRMDPVDVLMAKVKILKKLGIPKEDLFKSFLRILTLNNSILQEIVRIAEETGHRFKNLDALTNLYKKVNQKVEAETGRMIGSLVKEDPELLQRTVISILERLTFASPLFDQKLLELARKRGLDRASPQGAAQGLVQPSNLGHMYDLRIKTQILRQLGISEKDRTGGLRTIKDLNVLVLDAIVQNAAARGYRFETLRELADLYKELREEVKAKTGQWVGPLVRKDPEELQRTVIPILETLVPEDLSHSQGENPRKRGPKRKAAGPIEGPRGWDWDQVDPDFGPWVLSGKISKKDERIMRQILSGDEAQWKELMAQHSKDVVVPAQDPRSPEANSGTVYLKLSRSFPTMSGDIKVLRIEGARGFLPKERADREYFLMQEGQKKLGFETDYPIAVGTWKERTHKDQPSGFVISGMRACDQRIRYDRKQAVNSLPLLFTVTTGKTESVSPAERRLTYRRFGRSLRAYHDAGYFHRRLDKDGLGMDTEKDIFSQATLRNLGETLTRGELKNHDLRRLETAYRFQDVHAVLAALKEKRSDSPASLSSTPRTNGSLTEHFLKGYFREISPDSAEFSSLAGEAMSKAFAELKKEPAIFLNGRDSVYQKLWEHLYRLAPEPKAVQKPGTQKASRSEVREVSSLSFPHALSGNPGRDSHSGSPIKAFGDDKTSSSDPSSSILHPISGANFQNILQLQQDVIMVVERSEIRALSQEMYKELLELVGVNNAKLHLVIPDALEGEYSDRVSELKSVGRVYYGASLSTLPASAPVVGFSDMEKDTREAFLKRIDFRLSAKMKDSVFGVNQRGSFGIGILYALKDILPEGLSLNPNGFRYDATGRYTAQILETLKAYVVIARSA